MKRMAWIVLVLILAGAALIVSGYFIGVNSCRPSDQCWQYDSQKQVYVWIGGDREVISEQGAILEATKNGAVFRFTLSCPFRIDVSTGKLIKFNDDNTTQEWLYDPNDTTVGKEMQAGTYEYWGTSLGQDHDDNAGFKAFPHINGD